MGGTPSDKTNTTKSQRYANNKKGRTSSFFLYHRSKTSNTTSKQPLQSQSVVGHDSNDTISPTFKMLEMEVITTTPTDSESDDFHRSVSSMDGHHRTTSVIEPHIATKVQFSTIEIRCYTITIGDHPCCTIGCPITLDWDYVSDDTINLDEYEQQKQIYITSTLSSQQQQNHHHHHRNDLRISPQDRMELLLYHASIQKDNSNTSDTKLSEMEIRRASRKFHRTKLCSIKQNIRIHETFFHCPVDNDDNHDDYEEDDDDTNSTDTNSTSDDDEEERDHPDIDIHDNVDALATTKNRNVVCIKQLHEV